MIRRRLPARSTPLRLAAAMAALFVVAVLAAFLVAYWVIAEGLEARTRAEIEREARRLVETRGQAVDAGRSGTFYVVRRVRTVRRDGAVVTESFTGWRNVSAEALRDAVSGDPPPGRYIAFGAPADGGALIVAQNRRSIDDALDTVAGALLWGLGLAALLAVAGAFWLARRTERRIAAIASALDDVAAGDLSRRAPAPDAEGDDLGRVAAAINAMLDRLSANVEGLRQISSDIAHELKTPIQRLRATLERGTRKPGLDAEAVASIEAAIAQTDRIVASFQSLLRIAQIEGGGAGERFSAVDAGELAEAVGEAHAPAVEEAGHSFALDAEGARGAAVSGDRDLLAQCLSNLLNNAVRHCPPPAHIALTAGGDAGAVRLIVSDDGPGVPEAERERVFRRLYRLDRSRAAEGSGLGLSMAAAVATLHGGGIRLEDNAPGLRAVLTLPRARDEARAPKSGDQAAQGPEGDELHGRMRRRQ